MVRRTPSFTNKNHNPVMYITPQNYTKDSHFYLLIFHTSLFLSFYRNNNQNRTILTVECCSTHYKYKFIVILALTTLKKATRIVETFGGHYATKLRPKTQVRLLVLDICIYIYIYIYIYIRTCVCVILQGYSK